MHYFGYLKVLTGSAVGMDHLDLNSTGNILLPPSVLAQLSDFSSDKPLLFSLSHDVTNLTTHCGVLEFSAEEGSVIVPSWVIEQIGVECGDTIFVKSAILPVGSFARFHPISSDFLDIHDQKAVLERQLRHFACLTCGDIIPLEYNGKTYLLKVVVTEPNDAICIRNCDLEVDFETPVGHKLPPALKNLNISSDEEVTEITRVPTPMVVGYRLNGEKVYEEYTENCPPPQGVPDYDWKFGTLNFFRNNRKPNNVNVEEKCQNSPFPGTGRSLK